MSLIIYLICTFEEYLGTFVFEDDIECQDNLQGIQSVCH